MPLPRPQLRRAAFATACITLTVSAAPLGAQDVPPAPPVPQRNSMATNFIGIPFGFFSLEYERAAALPGLTIGVGGSHFAGDLEDDEDFGGEGRNSWAEVKALYYPGERPFRGFSIGLTAGVHAARGFTCDGTDPFGGCSQPAVVRTQSSPTLGVLANYDWLIGRRERFRVGTGIGAKRVLRNVRGDRDVLDQVYPDGRFVVGLTL